MKFVEMGMIMIVMDWWMKGFLWEVSVWGNWEIVISLVHIPAVRMALPFCVFLMTLQTCRRNVVGMESTITVMERLTRDFPLAGSVGLDRGFVAGRA